MFSPCYFRLASNLARNRLQLLTSGQISAENCFDWGTQLSKQKDLLSSIPTIKPILESFNSEPEFMVGLIRHNSIITGVIKFTSSLEYFLNDLVSLCMIRNDSLLKKGLKDIQINPFDIVEINDLFKIRYKYIEIIAQDKCKGELWSKKLKKVCRFLDISSTYYSNKINRTIDSIWEMRNIIAHSNPSILSFTDDGKNFQHTEKSNKETYIDFIVYFIKAADKINTLLEKMDTEALKKWPTKDF